MLSENDGKKLYFTGSRPGFFNGAAKVHKLQGNQSLNESTVRPIISNIGTATYDTVKYLSNLMSPLGESQNTAPNSKKFVEKIKAERIPIGYKIISFNVKSLFTNVPLDETIETMWKRKAKRQYQNRFSQNYYYYAQNSSILDLMVKHLPRLMEWSWDPCWANY